MAATSPSRPGRLVSAASTAVLALFAGLFLFPFAWMVTTSLKELPQAMRMPPQWIPDPVRWENFLEATRAIPFWSYAVNTLTLCVLCVAGTVASCLLAAYGFARIQWRGREALFAATLATMMIPFPVMMVPQYGIYRSLGWIGTSLPLWVPAFFGSAYSIFLMRQFLLTIPKELQEAAEIDGASQLQTFLHVILPLSRPVVTVVALFTFMGVWNDFMGPLIYLTDQRDFTLALGLQHFQSKHGGTDMNLLMAASTLVVLPIVVLFFFTQKTFIEGIAVTGIKG
ncbi:MAG: carbohydrate ABC transporter permease [Candidatus Sumerlaeia bacterium]|nr:carbohydrate ABC transporter permease [Candidatus Sumerlaeia bacterium]